MFHCPQNQSKKIFTCTISATHLLFKERYIYCIASTNGFPLLNSCYPYYVTTPFPTLYASSIICLQNSPINYISESHFILEKSNLPGIIFFLSWISNQSLFCFALHCSGLAGNQTNWSYFKASLIWAG